MRFNSKEQEPCADILGLGSRSRCFSTLLYYRPSIVPFFFAKLKITAEKFGRMR